VNSQKFKVRNSSTRQIQKFKKEIFQLNHQNLLDTLYSTKQGPKNIILLFSLFRVTS
jgi:ribosomal protein L20A (L18A)